LETLYDQIGGQTKIAELANKFYDIMLRDEEAFEVLHMHPKDLTRSRKRLTYYLCEWFGGPKLFGEQYVNSDWLKRRHQHLNINLQARDQWMYCMSNAMRELEYPEILQQRLNNKFFELAGYLRTAV
jgi:hemoglobin